MTIKKIVASPEVARQEVKRLNDLNGREHCRYYWQHTRLYSDDFNQIVLQAEENEA